LVKNLEPVSKMELTRVSSIFGLVSTYNMKIIRPSGRSKKDDSSIASEKEAVSSDGYDDRHTVAQKNHESEAEASSWKSKPKKKCGRSSDKRSKLSNNHSQSSRDNSRSEEEFEFDTSSLEAMPKEEVFEGPSKGKTRRRSELQAEKASEPLSVVIDPAKKEFNDVFARGLRLLAMREHSVKELTKKLFDKLEASSRTEGLNLVLGSKGSDSDSDCTADGSNNDCTADGSDNDCKADGSDRVDISSTIYAVIDDLLRQKYLSDERFTEVYIRSRRIRGFGPIKIKAELKNKGVSNHLIQDYLDEGSAIWFDSALFQYQKKYADVPINDYNEWTKRARFMQGRGFTMEHIHVTVPRVEFD
jgi:regulatory protein